MSKVDNIEPEKVDYDEKRLKRALGRRHQASSSEVLIFCLLLAAVAISIYIIEIYQ